MVSTILSSLYFSCLIGFSFVSHPVAYCVLLLVSALSVSGMIYSLVGMSWYLALFCLVYIGGVYVLFIFVSIHSPNPVSSIGGGIGVSVLFFLSFLIIFGQLGLVVPSFCECSHYLCSYYEGMSYCLFCLVLMVGFVSVSVVVGGKDSFYR